MNIKTHSFARLSRVICIFFLFLLLALCSTHEKVFASETPVGEEKQLSDKIRTITYNGIIQKACKLYPTLSSRQAVMIIPKGASVEILARKKPQNRTKIRYEKKAYYIDGYPIKRNSCNYTNLKYTTSQKLAFVNKYRSSTKYLIWISLYTQQVNIFKGKKGHWRLIKTYTCTTGDYRRHTPKGIFKVGRKERKWDYYNRYISYVTRFCSRNAFHSRIHRKKAYGGGYYYPDLGAPGSNGCIRLYDKDARYIYKVIPKGTTVISY